MDIGIAAPGTCYAADDCCEAMRAQKFRHYQKALPEMAASGLHYVPLIFSCHGRLDLETICTFENLAQQAARCIGIGDWRSVLRRVRVCIGVILVRRHVAMVRSCLKPLSPGALNFLFGDGLEEV